MTYEEKVKLAALKKGREYFDVIEKDSDAGRDWGQEEKGMTEDEMAG